MLVFKGMNFVVAFLCFDKSLNPTDVFVVCAIHYRLKLIGRKLTPRLTWNYRRKLQGREPNPIMADMPFSSHA